MILSYLLVYLFFLVLTASSEEYKTYKGYKIYSFEGNVNKSKNVVEFMENFYELPYHSREGNKTQCLISPKIATLFEGILKSKELPFNVLVNDYSEILKEERVVTLRSDDEFTWDAYHDVESINRYLTNMSRRYPSKAKLVVGGRTYEGRDILGLRITSPSPKKKPQIFLESGMHAREWITSTGATYFINELLIGSNEYIREMVDEFEWHVFPMVNPDGYQYSITTDRMWRKTRSHSFFGCYGADPNRNWDYNWGIEGSSRNPCNYQTYAGSKAFSEIETRTLSRYLTRLRNLQAYVAFHADAQMLLVPYSDSTDHIDNYDDLVKIGKASLDAGYEVNKERYKGPGTAAEMLYKASGGSMDWVKKRLGVPLVYTYELRGKHFNWPANRISEQGEEVTQMMFGMVTEAKKMGYL